MMILGLLAFLYADHLNDVHLDATLQPYQQGLINYYSKRANDAKTQQKNTADDLQNILTTLKNKGVSGFDNEDKLYWIDLLKKGGAPIDGSDFSTSMEITIWLFIFGFLAVNLEAAAWGPPRIVILRPFGPWRMSRPLRKCLDRNFRYVGHCYTISDEGIRESGIVDVIELIVPDTAWFAIGPFIRKSQRICRVSREREFRKLKRRMGRRFRLNQSWATTGGAPFNIKCTEAWWREVAEVLIWSADAIVVDTSDLRPGTFWELHRILLLDRKKKAILIAQEGTQKIAEDRLVGEFGESWTQSIYIYDDRGRFAEPEHVRSALHDAVTAIPSGRPGAQGDLKQAPSQNQAESPVQPSV